jgi:hypothetical protein
VRDLDPQDESVVRVGQIASTMRADDTKSLVREVDQLLQVAGLAEQSVDVPDSDTLRLPAGGPIQELFEAGAPNVALPGRQAVVEAQARLATMALDRGVVVGVLGVDLL